MLEHHLTGQKTVQEQILGKKLGGEVLPKLMR